jgi:LCP family protein required for cell wall assembly
LANFNSNDKNNSRFNQTGNRYANANTNGWNGKSMAKPLSSRRKSIGNPLNIKWNFTAILLVAFIVFLCATTVTFVYAITRNSHKKDTVSAAVDQKYVAPLVSEPQFDGQIKILLLGSDQRPNEGGFRTDAILMVMLDSDAKSVSVVSFPRDLWVQVPSLYEMKINQVYELGGFDAIAEMFEANFNIRPDYFVMTNFAGFTQFIDNRGGVDVNVGQSLTDDCDLPQQVDGDCSVEPGVLHMDGPTALWYVRSRQTTSDLDRLRREQEVLYALIKKLINFKTIDQLSSIKAEVAENVETNVGVEQGISLLPFITTVLNSEGNINHYAITEDHASPSWSWNGMWILLPDYNAIDNLLRQAGMISN